MFTDTRRIAAKRSTRTINAENRAIEASYYRHCRGTSIGITDIPKLYADARAALAAGQDLEIAMPGIIQKYAHA